MSVRSPCCSFALAKENLVTHTTDGYQPCQKSDKAPVDTRKEIAKAAGVSDNTIAKVFTKLSRIDENFAPRPLLCIQYTK